MAHPWEAKWKLEERLGKGGQGITHVASSIDGSSIRGALKYLKNNRDTQARGRMCREVANLKVLGNAGGAVPRVLDHNTDRFEDLSVELYVVMDLINGPTLSEYVESKQALSIDTSLNFALSLCKTVGKAHSFPILHRDLKPDNIIVRDANTYDLVIVDYGLSFNASDGNITRINETFQNQFLDLPETNTPSGNRRDPRSDLTAICAILYYCLTGNKPGQLQDGSGVLPHMREGYSLREKHNDERLSLLEEFFTRGFAPIIDNRYQTIDDVIAKLNDFVGSNQEFDYSDPVQLAVSLSLKLRANDRVTQLAEFREYAKELFKYISKEASKYRDKLGPFQISTTNFGMGIGVGSNANLMSIPDGLDLVELDPSTVILKNLYHPHQRHRRYAVASRGEQCVLLASDYTTVSQNPMEWVTKKLKWREIAWYEGNPVSIHSLVSTSYRNWVTSKMQELAEDILP